METVNQAEENMEKIAQLFPNCVTEIEGENGKLKKAIDFDKLKQMMADHVREGEEAYEFTWVGKKAAIMEANRPIRKTLRPCVEESKNWDTTENLYIEGDNLEALKLLQESYLGKVKMIYIDPPYNTGNDFVYNDDFKQDFSEYEEDSGTINYDGYRMKVNHNTDGRFHSKWCSMIYSRILSARNLLSNDGAIFISIDDNEVENLKKICNEIFGNRNFVAQLVWEKKKKGAFLNKNYINMKEYILVYAKNNEMFRGLIGEKTSSEETYPCIKTTNTRGLRTIRKGTISKYKEKDYLISSGTRVSSGNMELIYLDDLVVKNGILQHDVSVDSNWIYSQDKLDEYASKGLVYITQDNYIRRIVNDERVKMLKDLLTRVGNDGVSLANYRYDKNLNNGGWGTNEDANDELHKLLGQQYVFDFSKPTRLITKLIQTATEKDSIIMDFFAGSSATADSVMQLNAADFGHRKFIMVQVPEVTEPDSPAKLSGYNTICEIGEERIRRAGDKAFEQGINKIDIGFRIFKIDDSNMNDVYYGAEDYTQDLVFQMEDNVKSDRTDLDLLFSCLLDWGIPLSLPYTSEKIESCAVHNYNDGDLIACFDKNVPESVVKHIAKMQPMRAVFRDSSFADSSAKINVTEIFKLLAPDTEIRVL